MMGVRPLSSDMLMSEGHTAMGAMSIWWPTLPPGATALTRSGLLLGAVTGLVARLQPTELMFAAPDATKGCVDAVSHVSHLRPSWCLRTMSL